MILVAIRRLVRGGVCSVFLSGLGGVRRQLSASKMTSPGVDTEKVLAPLRKAVQEQVCAATATWTFCSAPNKATIEQRLSQASEGLHMFTDAHEICITWDYSNATKVYTVSRACSYHCIITMSC